MRPEGTSDYWQPEAEAPLQAISSAPAPAPAPVASESITWQASEYVHHEKEGMWFVGLIGITVVFLLVAIFLIQSPTFAILIVVMAIAMGVLAMRPPRIMHYALHPQGLEINEKSFSFHDFRAFGIIEDGSFYAAMLVPTKRFMPAVMLYFSADMGERIVDMLGANMPMEHVELDIVDKITRKLRF